MNRPGDLRKMEEFWLTRGEWFLVCGLELLAWVFVVGCVVLAGLGVYGLSAAALAEPNSPEGAVAGLTMMALAPAFFLGAVGCLCVSVGMVVAATGLRFRGSFRLLIHQHIPTPRPASALPPLRTRV
jgi:hypothetical protein